ncbi:PIN domain-containing protein [Gemmatimonas sp.]|uniref:PIN domain-containing protein n=1 Tax=Gemmatimonas sp. TaxID=1962908 RepID=UPI003563E82E
MTIAFVDSSCVLSMLLDEAHGARMQRQLSEYDHLMIAPLLEAEVYSAAHRERRSVDHDLLRRFRPIFAPRSLRPEIERVLVAGYVRGADCLHLATALYLAPDPGELTFLTLDERQRAVAVQLGFAT